MKYAISVHYNGKTHTIYAEQGKTLAAILREHGFPVDMPCGGNGTCGKCGIRVSVDGGKPAAQKACRLQIAADTAVWLDRAQRERVLLSGRRDALRIRPNVELGEPPNLGAAIDIGTTTVAAWLYDLKSGVRLGEVGEPNVQRAYGADVISRIQYSIEHPGGAAQLRDALRSQINHMLGALHSKKSQIRYLSITGNTTMLHLLSGLNPSSMACTPYTPQSLFGEEYPAAELGLSCKRARAFLAPAVSAYVGGDITAGVLATRLYRKRKFGVLVDVGTNGEIVAGDHKGLYCCAAAAGPAFEGASIACGMTAREGAVCRVDWKEGRLCYDVIGAAAPQGICGSGLIDLLAVLLRTGAVDRGGRLLPRGEAPQEVRPYLTRDDQNRVCFHITRQVFLTEEDVRKLQLAKAAIRAGIQVLIDACGRSVEEIHTLFLAGGFGNALRKESAVEIGLIPPVLLAKIHPVGNAAGSGAIQALLNAEEKKALLRVAARMQYRELSGNPAFEQEYLDAMYF